MKLYNRGELNKIGDLSTQMKSG